MVQDLFGVSGYHQPIMTAMTAFEIALLIGHKRALREIALSKYTWGAVFEDDAYLHEAVAPTLARNLLADAFAAAEAAPRPEPPLLYIGSCEPRCESDVVLRRDQEALGAGLPEALLRVGRCFSYCTHAYALSRGRAATFFDDVFNCANGTAGCGSSCDVYPCFMDWSMVRYNRRSQGAWIVGGGLQSQFNDMHRGLFIQNRSKAFNNSVKGSALVKRFRWHNDSSSCELKVETPTSRKPLRRLFVTIDWTGRIGNLMFEVAMLASVVQRLRKIVPNAAAVTFGLPSGMETPAKEMFDVFPVSRLVQKEFSAMGSCAKQGAPCLDVDQVNGFEYYREFKKRLATCGACKLGVQERFANACDRDLLPRLASWAANPPHGCAIGLIKMEGYFQSFKYFDGVVDDLLRSTIFVTSLAVQREADGILSSVRRGLPRERGWKIVGVQVRLGDKAVGTGKYGDLFASTSWDYYRTAMHGLSSMLQHRGAPGVAFVVTAGGGMGSNDLDVQYARSNLTTSSGSGQQRIVFATSSNAYVDFAVLRGCDALVIGPSTFGWWAAYLAKLPPGHVVAPRHIINRNLRSNHTFVRRTGFNRSHYYPPGWRLLENDAAVGGAKYQ